MYVSFHQLAENPIWVISPDSTTASHNDAHSHIWKSWDCRERNLYKSIVAHRLPRSRPLNPWQSSHRPCAESMSGLGCNRKREGKERKRQGWRGWGVLTTTTKKKKVGTGVGGGEDGVRGRFMGDVYYYTALPQGGEGRGVGRERQNIPFPLPLLGLYRSHTGGEELCPAASRRRGSRRCCFCPEMLGWVGQIE